MSVGVGLLTGATGAEMDEVFEVGVVVVFALVSVDGSGDVTAGSTFLPHTCWVLRKLSS